MDFFDKSIFGVPFDVGFLSVNDKAQIFIFLYTLEVVDFIFLSIEDM